MRCAPTSWRETGDLADFKRVGGYLLWEKDFPRTASLKIKRGELAAEIGAGASRAAIVESLGSKATRDDATPKPLRLKT